MKNQTLWETWFIFSCTLFIMAIIQGTMVNSKTYFPNFPYFFAISIINLSYCLYTGTKK